MRGFLKISCLVVLALAISQLTIRSAAAQAASAASAEYGIAVKKPVFAGACKACPWGELAAITKEALSHYGYDVLICYTCAQSIGPRDMADKADNQQNVTLSPYSEFSAYVELTPRRVPDISATRVAGLIDAWNGTGNYAQDNKKRQNFRIIATVDSVSYYAVAVAKRTGITNLSQVKNRRNIWVAASENDPVLAYYGITKASLEANGGGIISTNASRDMRAGADVWIGNASLNNTWEHRMWYEVSQMVDMVFLDLEPALIEKMVQDNFTRVTMPIAVLRGVDRLIPTVSRSGATAIYVRDEAPDDFAYTVAKALDENRDLFRMQIQPWYYDGKDVAKTTVIPLHPGARKYYLERGYIEQKKFQEDALRTSRGDVKITCIGHGTLMFAFGGKVIHVDPVSNYADYATLPKADLILITHEHGDHLDAKAIQAVSTADTVLITNPGSLKALPKGMAMKNGESKVASGITIEAVPAYNPEKAFHPKGNGNGYVLTFGDKRVYVAGDTENVPEVKALKQIDVAFLPMNLPYTMTPEQVADVAKAIQPKVLYPYHFGNTDTSLLVNLLKDEKGIELRVRDMK